MCKLIFLLLTPGLHATSSMSGSQTALPWQPFQHYRNLSLEASAFSKPLSSLAPLISFLWLSHLSGLIFKDGVLYIGPGAVIHINKLWFWQVYLEYKVISIAKYTFLGPLTGAQNKHRVSINGARCSLFSERCPGFCCALCSMHNTGVYLCLDFFR